MESSVSVPNVLMMAVQTNWKCWSSRRKVVVVDVDQDIELLGMSEQAVDDEIVSWREMLSAIYQFEFGRSQWRFSLNNYMNQENLCWMRAYLLSINIIMKSRLHTRTESGT